MKTLLCFACALMVWSTPTRATMQAADTAHVIDIMAVNKVARQLIAPCCWSETADAHRSEAAVQMRAQIREALQRGFLEEQIIASYVKEYGERVLSTPKAEGFNYMAWIMPGVALMFGVAFVGRFLRRNVETKPAPSVQPTNIPNDAYTERIERELREFGG